MVLEPKLDPPAERLSLWRRLAWMAALWLTGVAMVGVVALLLRLAIR